MQRRGLAAWAVLCALQLLTVSAFAPNHFLGTCLNSTWVTEKETTLGISSTQRNADGRLTNPFLHKALQYPRFRVDDPRTESKESFTATCMGDNMHFYGPGAVSESQTISGRPNGTFVMDFRSWITHRLTSMVFAIIVQEVQGYSISVATGGLNIDAAKRMSSAPIGLCTPTHINLEVWAGGIKAALQVYANESFSPGGIGYYGVSGIYTTRDFVRAGHNESLYSPIVFPNYWEHYQNDSRLINALNVSSFKACSKYYPPPAAENACNDGVLGCEDSCSKSEACTIRENAGGECLVVVMQYANSDRGYFQAVLSNLKIPAYFCFIGYDLSQEYALEAQRNGTAVLFYHWEPDLFHIANPGLFERVMLPRSLPERVALTTGTYGENGYGNKTDNPVDVDFPAGQPSKYAASLLTDLPIGSFVSKFSLSDLDIVDLLRKYNVASGDASIPDPYFNASCKWVRDNYDTWRLWLDRLPLCSFETHINYTVTGCNSTSDPRVISFKWNMPDPDNISQPYECDGGYAELPGPLTTSRSCEWINARSSDWVGWISTKPNCDSSFYAYNVSDCNSLAKRIVKYHWLLPSATNSSESTECEGGQSLPSDVTIECEYMPSSSPVVTVVSALVVIQNVVLLCLFIFIFRHRAAPIIKRSQFELLECMVVGGFLTTSAAIAYAGRPTDVLCGLRPVLLSFGFTTIFGALFVKSLRVYRVFMQKSMKRSVITLRMMLKVLASFYLIDVIILAAWGGADYPKATVVSESAVEFRGEVDRIACRSASFIFSALVMFWKAILLFAGLYLSFLIRKVSVDFQESMWIFSSAMVVMFACLVIIPLAYLVDLSASAFFVFLAGVLILCTATVIALMLVPKLHRLTEPDMSRTSSASSTGGPNTSKRLSGTTAGLRQPPSASGGNRTPSAKYSIRPVQQTSTGSDEKTTTTAT